MTAVSGLKSVASLLTHPETATYACSSNPAHHYSSGLYSTRLETRTKESSKCASRTVFTRLVRRSERNCCDLLTERNSEVSTGTLSAFTGTRKMVIYA